MCWEFYCDWALEDGVFGDNASVLGISKAISES